MMNDLLLPSVTLACTPIMCNNLQIAVGLISHIYFLSYGSVADLQMISIDLVPGSRSDQVCNMYLPLCPVPGCAYSCGCARGWGPASAAHFIPHYFMVFVRILLAKANPMTKPRSKYGTYRPPTTRW